MLAVVIAARAAAASVPGTRAPAATVRDTIPVVTYPAVSLTKASGIRLDSTRQLTITGAEPCLFDRISGVVIEHDGDIALADGGTREICVYSARGQLVAHAGDKGQGPGEYRYIDQLYSGRGDSLVVWDDDLERLTVLGADGRYARSFLIRTAPDTALGRPTRVLPLRDGSFLVGYSEVKFSKPSPEPVVFYQQLFRYDANGRLQRGLGRFFGSEHFVQSVPPSMGGTAYWSLAFGRSFSMAVVPGGFVAGDGTEFSVTQYSDAGVPDLLDRIPLRRRPVTRADIAADRKSDLSGASPRELPVMRKLADAMPYPSTFPAYRRILTDPAGRIWLEIYPSPTDKEGHWLILDPVTRTASLLVTPAGFELEAATRARVCGVTRDAYDVESVECFGLAGP